MPVINVMRSKWTEKKKNETKIDSKINITTAEKDDIIHSTPKLKRTK